MKNTEVIVPGLLGNVLEWYDFALYGYFASSISPLFFPNNNHTMSYIWTFAVFAIGFIMRPLGAVLFGYYGDRFGRKNALSAAILLMAIPTTLIGCLPSYQNIGIWAPCLLILCRLLQGLAVGGEFTGSIVYLIEHAPQGKRALYGSLAMSSAFIGLLLGSLCAYLTYLFFPNHMNAWRFPFLASLILGLLGLYLRLGMPESPVFAEFIKQHKTEKFPIKYVLQHYKKKVLTACALVMLPSCGFYMSFVYLPTYLIEYIKFDKQVAMQSNSMAMLIIIFFIPLVGLLAEKVSHMKILKCGAFCFMIFSLPVYLLLQFAEVPMLYLCLIILAMMVSISYSLIPVVLVDMFPTKIRLTGMSLPYNLANALFGGTAPLVATKLIALSNWPVIPGLYLTLLATITFLISLFYIPEKD